MGWVHPEIMCMMHPDEKNHPGVCSSCLREKLKKLPGLPFTMDQPNSLSSPTRYSSCSSASSSVCLSPNNYNNNHHPGHRRISSNVVTVGEKGVFVISGGGGGKSRMGKSRSVAASVKRKRVRNNVVAGSKKKEGFWSKLIRSTSMKTRCVFVQSKHAKE